MRIYVIRQGETLLNCKGVLQGWLDVSLNEKGKGGLETLPYIFYFTLREMRCAG